MERLQRLGSYRRFLLTMGGLALLWAAPAHADEPRSRDEMQRFLESAEVVAAQRLESGMTGAWRLTLTDGETTHDAIFQSVDFKSRHASPDGEPVVDSYRHTLAACRLAELVGLAHLMPVTVERTWLGRTGALGWWIDDVMFDEEIRLAQRRWPPDLDAWGSVIDRMWIFAELVHDIDRHGGNLLYAADWTPYMIDFTRAFQPGVTLMKPYRLRRIEPALRTALEALDTQSVTAATAPYLTPSQIETVLRRRDAIVAHVRAQERGNRQ